MAAEGRLLTIGIPTFNRGSKSLRLLRSLWAQIQADGLEEDVELLVSDNASPDETSRFLERGREEGIRFVSVRQTQNIGDDRNFLYLVEHAKTPYVWLFGDDDLPLDGAVARVAQTLRSKRPDLLLFSFQQPPGSSFRAFEHVLSERESTDPAEAIELAVRYMKLTVYVFRRVTFSSDNASYVGRIIGSHWLYLGLVFCTLAQAVTPRVIVFRDQLARCDDDYKELLGEQADSYRELHRVFDHPFIRLHQPSLPAKFREIGYRAAISSVLAVWGNVQYKGDRRVRLRQFVRSLQWEFDLLLRDPKLFAQLVLLKSGAAWLYPLYRTAIRGLGRSAAQ